MSMLVSLQFRPTIIIFVGIAEETTQGRDIGSAGIAGRTSRTVYEHFCNLCVGLDKVLYQGIGLITVGEGEQRAKPIPLRDAPPCVPSEEDDFPNLLAAMMRSIQGERCRQDIEGAGYPVMRPQIYIVGETISAWVSQVAEWVNAELRNDRLATLVYYVLIDFPRYRAISSIGPQRLSTPVWTADLCSQNGAMPRVNFCYMYEELGQRQTFMQDSDIRYAAAESLFGLVATSMTSSPTFMEATQVSSGITNIDSRIGSLGTSLVMFPRATIGRYCADEHGVEITDHWISTIQRGGMSREQQDKLREQAYQDALQIRDDLADQQAWPDEDGRFLSSLAFLKDDDRVGQLEEATERVFQCYLYKNVADDVTERDTWSVIARRRESQAAVAFRALQNIAETIWVEAGQALQQRIGKTVDELWFRNAGGAILAKVYADQLDDALRRVRDRFSDWRQEHQDNYEHELSMLQERGMGPWAVPPTASPLLGDAGAHRRSAYPTANTATSVPPDHALQTSMPPSLNAPTTWGGMPPAHANTAPPVDDPAGQPQQPASSSRLPERERTIVANLGACIDWRRSQVPTIENLVAIGIMVVLPLALLMITLPPLSSLAVPLAELFGITGSAGLIAASSWLLRTWSQRCLYEAEKDLLSAYRLYYAYRYKWWEDQLRVVILSPLIGKVRRMRARLEDMQGFIGRIAKDLRQSAERAEAELFDSPSGLRDVFVGNGELLSKRGYGYGLVDFNREIRRRRQSNPNPGEAWHRTYDQISARLRDSLDQHNDSILDLDEDQIGERIRSFSHEMIATYLKGDLVDIGPALGAKGDRGKQVWQKALGNSTVLYRPFTNALELIYIGGRDEHRATVPARAIPGNTTMICTTQREWLLVARFWTGGAGTHWRANSFERVSLAERLPKIPSW